MNSGSALSCGFLKRKTQDDEWNESVAVDVAASGWRRRAPRRAAMRERRAGPGGWTRAAVGQPVLTLQARLLHLRALVEQVLWVRSGLSHVLEHL